MTSAADQSDTTVARARGWLGGPLGLTYFSTQHNIERANDAAVRTGGGLRAAGARKSASGGPGEARARPERGRLNLMRREIEGCRVIDGAIINREFSDSSKLVNPTRWAVLNRNRQPLFKAAHLNLSPLQPRKKNDFESDDSAAAFSFNHNKGATQS